MYILIVYDMYGVLNSETWYVYITNNEPPETFDENYLEENCTLIAYSHCPIESMDNLPTYYYEYNYKSQKYVREE